MEVFETKPRVERQFSSASAHIRRNSKVGYILTMAGIILFTSALLVILHFTREYKKLSQGMAERNSRTAEKLERRTCDVPFCNTQDCVFVAATMIDSMNSNADPCSDFYEYACGGYSRVKAVPYANDHYSPAKEAQEELLIDIRKSLEKLSSDDLTSTMNKMKKIYDSCLNSTLRDEVENRTLSTWFADIKLVPDTYVLGSAFDFDHLVQWTELITNLEQYQVHTLFKPSFVAGPHSAPKTMEVDCLVPTLDPEAYFNTTDDELAFQFVMYKESMNGALEQLHMDRAARNEFIEDVLKIERDVARTILEETPTYSYLSEEFKQQLREIWRPVVGEAIQDMDIVSVCKYDMQDILTILNSTPNKSLIKYIMWKMLMHMMQYMGTELRSMHLHYMTKLPGTDYAYESKWKECADVVRNELGLVVTKVLLDNGYFQQKAVDTTIENFEALKRGMSLIFSSLIQEVDESFSKKFLDKLQSMKLDTEYLGKIKQDGVLDGLYADMEVGEEYFSNILEMKRFKARKNFLRLWYQSAGEETSRVPLDPSPLGSSSSYDYISNTVRLDLGLLRPPVTFISDEIPEYLHFAFMSLLAREMSRAFDATGSFYDAEGRRFEKIWWPSAIEQKYNNFQSCISNQIAGLNENSAEINDTRLLNNIMADMASFFLPYEGLKTHLESHESGKPLPGISLTKKQTFYVQVAQMFCEIRNKPSSDSMSKFLLSSKSRVNVAIMNMKDFGSIFSCPDTSTMNIENKCNLLNFLPEKN